MKHGNVTIKFLAEKAGMSFSTVAKALHDDPLISEATRAKIHALAREYEYRPNMLAKGLRSRKTKIIGLILNDLQSPFYSEIYRAIGSILNSRGYTMLLADSSYDEDLEAKNISTMISQGAEGVIISPVSRESGGVRTLLNSHVRTVFIDDRPPYPDNDCVYVDHEAAARMGTELLVDNGHTRILLLNGPERLPSSVDYLAGYRAALTARGIPFQGLLVRHGHLTIDATSSFFDAVFAGGTGLSGQDFSAILTLSDVQAMGVYEAALRHGFRIPEDYSLVGYDNILGTKYLAPPLTTIQQPKEETGLLSVNLLLDLIEKKQSEHRQIILRPELILRSSVLDIRP